MSVMFLVPGLPHHGVVLRDGEGGGLEERFVLRLVDCSLRPAFLLPREDRPVEKGGTHGRGVKVLVFLW